MPKTKSEPERDENGNIILNPVRSITLGEKVIEVGYDDFPVLGKTPLIACFVECGDHPSGEIRTLQLALTVPQAKQLVDQVSKLLGEYGPPEEGPSSVH